MTETPPPRLPGWVMREGNVLVCSCHRRHILPEFDGTYRCPVSGDKLRPQDEKEA